MHIYIYMVLYVHVYVFTGVEMERCIKYLTPKPILCETTFMKPRGQLLQSQAIPQSPVLHRRNLGIDSGREQLMFGEESQYSIP